MPIEREAVQILVRDLRAILLQTNDNAAKTALRRVNLFDYMHLREPENPSTENTHESDN